MDPALAETLGGVELLGAVGADTRLRRSFSDITPTTFVWRNEEAHGEYGPWRLA